MHSYTRTLSPVAYTYIPSTPEVEAGVSEVQGQPWQHLEFQAALDYRRLKELAKHHENLSSNPQLPCIGQ